MNDEHSKFEIGFNKILISSVEKNCNRWQSFSFSRRRLILNLKKNERYISFFNFEVSAVRVCVSLSFWTVESACVKAGAESIHSYVSQCAERGKNKEVQLAVVRAQSTTRARENVRACWGKILLLLTSTGKGDAESSSSE